MIIFLAFTGLGYSTNGEQHCIYVYVIAMSSYILINYVEQAITKNKSNMFIYSLPIEKQYSLRKIFICNWYKYNKLGYMYFNNSNIFNYSKR